MKVAKFIVLVIFLGSVSAKILEISEKMDLRVKCADEIIDGLFIDKFHATTINLVSSARNENSSFEISKMINQLMEKIQHDQDEITITLESVEKMDNIKFPKKKFFNVFFVDSYKGLNLILSKLDSKKFAFDGGYLIILSKEITNEHHLKRIFEKLWSLYIVNADVIVKKMNEKFVSIYTYFPFAVDKDCENTDPKLLTTYHATDGFKDKNVSLSPKKIGNFHKCPLSIAVYNNPPFIMIDKKNNEIEGIEGFLIQFLRDKLNFTLKLEVLAENSWASIDENGHGVGIAGMVMGKEVNFTTGFVAISPRRNKYMSPGEIHYTTNLVWMISPGHSIPIMERMRKVFDQKTWMMIMIVVLVSSVVILMIKCQSEAVQNFVFGRNNRNPFMTMLAVAYGNNLTRLPGRNFARYLLMVFILYSMIMRNAYTGTMFKFLKQDIRFNNPESMEDLKTRNYSYFAIDELKYLLNYSSTSFRNEFAQHIIFLDNQQFKRFRTKYIHKMDNNLAVLSSEDQITYYNQKSHQKSKQGTENFLNTLNEVFMSVNLCIYFQKNSCLKPEFDEQIMSLNSNGLIGASKNYYANRVFLKEKSVEKEPKKFGFAELIGGFFFYIVGIVVSTFAFFLELFYEKLTAKEKFSLQIQRSLRNFQCHRR